MCLAGGTKWRNLSFVFHVLVVDTQAEILADVVSHRWLPTKMICPSVKYVCQLSELQASWRICSTNLAGWGFFLTFAILDKLDRLQKKWKELKRKETYDLTSKEHTNLEILIQNHLSSSRCFAGSFPSPWNLSYTMATTSSYSAITIPWLKISPLKFRYFHLKCSKFELYFATDMHIKGIHLFILGILEL